jgi:UDP-3-O-[3-hydroxymyristoyl] glucosamine N-acyltransferase
MKHQKEIKDSHDRVVNRIKEMYSAKGEELSEFEAAKAANNLIGFCNTLIKIQTRIMKEEAEAKKKSKKTTSPSLLSQES